MNSMTGYGYKELKTDDIFASVEIKSWNSRFLDLSLSMPPFLGKLEKNIRDTCSSKIYRGKVDVSIKLRETNNNVSISTNVGMAKKYFDAIKEIALSLGFSKKQIPLSMIIEQDGVLQVQKDSDSEKYLSIIEPLLSEALKEFCSDREREGENLKIDLLEKLSKIEESEAVFKQWIPQMEGVFKANIEKRFQELLGENYDQQRVMTEIASMLVKYTINEEVVRLQSHIDCLKTEIEKNATPGRKIDFICQEMNREINTIGSKNQFIEVGQAVIKAKDALENIREQAKNVE